MRTPLFNIRHPAWIALGGAVLLLGVLSPAAVAANTWNVIFEAQQGAPNGWVHVRENKVRGTRLSIDHDLGASSVQTVRVQAWKPLSGASQLHLDFATHRIYSHTTLATQAYFNGATLAPGSIGMATRFQDFLAFHAAYWRRLFGFDHGSLWGSIGVTYTMLNFRIHGRVAANSGGHELKEDFLRQELPVPVMGLHLRYPLSHDFTLDADASWGRLPWMYSMRNEGGRVWVEQTDKAMQVGLTTGMTGAGASGSTSSTVPLHRAKIAVKTVTTSTFVPMAWVWVWAITSEPTQ